MPRPISKSKVHRKSALDILEAISNGAVLEYTFSRQETVTGEFITELLAMLVWYSYSVTNGGMNIQSVRYAELLDDKERQAISKFLAG